MQEIPLSNCPALGFQDTFLYLNRAILMFFLKLKWKPRHWWLAPSYQPLEFRDFAGKILKIYSLNIWGISCTDRGCPVSISETAAEKFWIKSSGLSQFSSNSDLFLFPTDIHASSSQTYHDPSRKSETHVLWLSTKRQLLLSSIKKFVPPSLS